MKQINIKTIINKLGVLNIVNFLIIAIGIIGFIVATEFTILMHLAILPIIGLITGFIFYFFYVFIKDNGKAKVRKVINFLLVSLPFLASIATILNFVFYYHNPLSWCAVEFIIVLPVIDLFFWLIFFRFIMNRIDAKRDKIMISLITLSIIILLSVGFWAWKNLSTILEIIYQ